MEYAPCEFEFEVTSIDVVDPSKVFVKLTVKLQNRDAQRIVPQELHAGDKLVFEGVAITRSASVKITSHEWVVHGAEKQ